MPFSEVKSQDKALAHLRKKAPLWARGINPGLRIACVDFVWDRAEEKMHRDGAAAVPAPPVVRLLSTEGEELTRLPRNAILSAGEQSVTARRPARRRRLDAHCESCLSCQQHAVEHDADRRCERHLRWSRPCPTNCPWRSVILANRAPPTRFVGGDASVAKDWDVRRDPGLVPAAAHPPSLGSIALFDTCRKCGKLVHKGAMHICAPHLTMHAQYRVPPLGHVHAHAQVPLQQLQLQPPQLVLASVVPGGLGSLMLAPGKRPTDLEKGDGKADAMAPS